MNTIARFFKVEDAYLFRSFLESEGIPAHVFDESVPQVYWLYAVAIGGIRVMVAPDDARRAAETYQTYNKTISTGPAAIGDVKWWPAALILSVIFSGPFMLFGRKSPEPKSGNP